MTKLLIVMSAFLSSASVFACPNLTGTFSDPANNLTLVIRQNDCSQISIDQGTGPATYGIDGKPYAVPGSQDHVILSWDGSSLVIGSAEMPSMRQKWSLTAKGDLQDEEDLYNGSQWQQSGDIEVISRTSGR